VCIKLVIVQDYTKMDGQQNIKNLIDKLAEILEDYHITAL